MVIIEQLKQVLDELEIPVWISDENMQVIYFNKAWFRLTGRKYEDECNGGWLFHTPEYEREHFINVYVAYFDLREPFEIELTTKDFRQRDCFLLLKGVPLFTTDSTCKGYVTFAYNQTETVRTRRELQRSESFFRTLFEKSPTGILVVDSLGRIQECNEVYVQLSGEEDKESSLQINYFENQMLNAAGVTENFKNCIESNQTLFFESLLDYGVKGKKIFSYRLTPIALEANEIGVLAFVEDITEKKVIEDKFLQDHKITTLGNLAAGIAHELNSPLGVVRISCDLMRMTLEEGQALTDEQELCLSNIQKSTERMTAIIKQVMNYSRGNTTLRKELLDLNVIIEDSLKMYGKSLRIDNIEVVLDFDRKLPSFMGSLNHIQTVVTDFINTGRDNLKTVAKEKKILMRTSYIEELNSICFQVSDNGPAYSFEQKSRIFEPFFSAGQSESSCGLGLSIANNIIKEHGGSIGLESVPNEGNNFRVLLPV